MSMRPVYEPPGLSNSQAISCPSRASFAHFDALFGFCSSQRWLCSSVNVLSLECLSLSVQVFISVNTFCMRGARVLLVVTLQSRYLHRLRVDIKGRRRIAVRL